jgi:hypothetical protein
MQHLQIAFNNINISVQVGDLVFYIPTYPTGKGFEWSNDQKKFFGPIIEIDGNTLVIEYDNINNPHSPPLAGDYIMFAKDQVVNKSGLKGYYLSAKFINDSKIPSELYSVGTEVSESSK